MTNFDVIIVGAGPAGSSAAYFLAQGGAKVALLDKKKFPRDKTCGDGLTSPSLGVLERMGLATWVSQYNAPEILLLSGPNYKAVEVTPTDNFCYGRVVPRFELDETLLKQAIQAGAVLFEESEPTLLTREAPDQVILTVKSRSALSPTKLSAKLVMCADGAHGSFTKKLGLMRGSPDLVAVRAYFENVNTSKNMLEIHLDSTVIPGYAWIFPMNDGRANVGLGTYSSRTKQRKVNLRSALEQFLTLNPYARQRLENGTMIGNVIGFPIRTMMQNSTPVADNLLVIGEAAGVVDPITGDGISEALETGEFAAHHALKVLKLNDFSEEKLAPYGQWLRKTYGKKHLSALMMRNLLRYHGLVNRLIKQAQRDDAFALNLSHIMIGFNPTYHMLKPDNLLRFLRG